MDSTEAYVSTSEFSTTLTALNAAGDVVPDALVRLSLDFADTGLTSATVQYYTADAVVATTFEVGASRRRAVAEAGIGRFSRRGVPRQPRTTSTPLVAGSEFLELTTDKSGRLELTIVAADMAAPVLLVDTTAWWDGVGYEVVRLHPDDQVNTEMAAVTGDDIRSGKNGKPLADNLSASDASAMATTMSGIAGAISPSGVSGSDPTLSRRDVGDHAAPVFQRPLARGADVHLHVKLGRHGGGDASGGLSTTRYGCGRVRLPASAGLRARLPRFCLHAALRSRPAFIPSRSVPPRSLQGLSCLRRALFVCG